MKLNLLPVLFIFTCGCYHNSLSQKLLPETYLFPETQIGPGKTFVYINRNTGDTTCFDIFHTKLNEKTFLVQCSYNKNSVSDSMIFIDRKLVGYYINPFNNGRLWKANKITDTLTKNENGKLIEVSEFYWENDSFNVSVRNETQIVKDTLMKWHGEDRPAVITSSISETKSNFLQTPKGDHDFTIKLTEYMCKGIGSRRRLMFASWTANPIVVDLLEIRNMRKE